MKYRIYVIIALGMILLGAFLLPQHKEKELSPLVDDTQVVRNQSEVAALIFVGTANREDGKFVIYSNGKELFEFPSEMRGTGE